MTPSELSDRLRERSELLEKLAAVKPDKPGELAESLDAWIASSRPAEGTGASESHLAAALTPFVRALSAAARWAEALLAADPHPERFLASARAQAEIARPHVNELTPAGTQQALIFLDKIGSLSSLSDVPDAALALSRIPVGAKPPRRDRAFRPSRDDHDEEEPTIDPIIVKAVFSIDGKPWANQQVASAGVLHGLQARVAVSQWPAGADKLKLSYITTLPPTEYSITDFTVAKPADGSLGEFEVDGHVRFPAPQSVLAEPIVLKVVAEFLVTGGESVPAPVIGYHELRVRAADPARVPYLTKYKVLDARLQEMVAEIQDQVTGLPSGQLDDFVAVMSEVLNFQGRAFQSGRYKQVSEYLESDFQRDVVDSLRQGLGEEISEGEKLIGGTTDARSFGTIPVEFKVERKLRTVEEICGQYTGQPTQYGAGGTSQLSIACVLDITSKNQPLGDPRNYVRLVTPQLHGYEGDEPYPSRVAVVIIPGNLMNPSDFSKPQKKEKKTASQ